MKVRTLRKDKVNIITLGCSKNTVDSEVLLSQLNANDIDAHHQREKDDCNIIIVNTCGFIDNAKQESIDTILNYAEAKANGEIDKLYVTGCLSHRYKDELQLEIPEVDAWFGTMELPQMLKRFNADYKHELIGERRISTPSHYAYLKISEGCNRTCSFCAIPLMRGNHVSKTIEEIVKEAKYLASIGVKEIMLIAQELTYYGLDIYKKRTLPELLYALNEVDGIEWIRLHYAYPSKFPLEIIDAIKNCDHVCNYLDMPLQHASNNILRAMNRQISKEETIELINNIRTQIPDIGLRTTMLVGFPGETEEDVDELAEFVDQMKFDRLGVFTYSHEEGTSGYLLKDEISAEEKSERAARIMEVQQQISLDKNQEKVGKVFKVLIDRVESNNFVGRTEFDSPEVDNEVLIDASKFYLRVGDFTNIKIIRAEEFDLFGEPL
ncbi:MAG: 30S ribosomal protein S12 methylthiotransferase RimO [Chitinophagales bacterium]|jgi:ribosomal protein S12 methylthiotransferase|nr:30S ribosomal protein S12 methylthiotransferase RimO [Bacteroidota bacterium]MBK7568128.1 30S ribosomal protein S12 methylthiotransferase RimO [Bacteroidota bacterium]MBP8916498.1 30S ribosomal protein S12 methylthiotransferase RimO [Chitinophagales bacterium]MBP9221336.1 30S ribosomal protein S12 methylthiotransferase RimO [Chitinophagales bacterium]MBP9795826.1 30S ribosomal protein S12 methylthiotransferase RimO [Chitinophagales bacterium]